jgi:hypothetical protein
MSIHGEVDSAPKEEIEMSAFSGVKVFSATKARERGALGESITSWMRDNPTKYIVEKIVTQSSDSEFHCLTITMFYKEEVPRVSRPKGKK